MTFALFDHTKSESGYRIAQLVEQGFWFYHINCPGIPLLWYFLLLRRGSQIGSILQPNRCVIKLIRDSEGVRINASIVNE